MPVPLRAVIVVLVVACIAVVAVLCTSLSVWSGDRALNDTLDSGRHSVDIAFAAGHETVVKVTEDYLKQIGESTVRQLASFWSITENSVSSVCQQLMADDMAMMESWTNLNSYRVQMYQLSRNHYEIDGLGIVSRKYQSVQVFQSRLTMARAETEYHHFHAILNNGTDHDILGGVHAINRTVVVDVIPGGKALAYEYATDAGKNVFPFCLGNGITAIMTDGAAFDPPCRYPEYDLVTKHLKAFLLLPQMGVGFNLQLVGLGDYVGMTTQCVYGNALTGERVGVVYGGSDMVKISHFLASIDIGQSRNSLGRIFVTVRKNWLSPGNMNIQHGYLAGTSHGSNFAKLAAPIDGAFVRPIHAEECNDTLVSATAKYLGVATTVNGTDASRYESVYLQGTSERLMLPTDRAPAGEEFFVSVQVFENGRGINWYVNTLIDREYVLGRVDTINTETLVAIAESESAVRSDLDAARGILYLVVALAAAIPIGFTVYLVYRITEPLIRLKDQMSYVAVMCLDQVETNLTASSLTEVRAMEISFAQMLQNLREYRQYLPQSVLCDSMSDDDATSSRRAVAQEGTLPEDSERSVHSAVSAHRPPASLCTSSLNDSLQKPADAMAIRHSTRNVSLFISNVCNLHNQQNVIETLLQYLDPIVQNARKFRGIVDDINGDRVAVAFNTIIPTVFHKTKAVEFGVLLSSRWGGVDANFAVASGSALCGNVGCHGMKKYSVLGTVACNVRAIERCGRAWDIPMLLDGVVASEVKDRYYLKKVVKVALKQGKDTLLHQLLHSKHVATDEWMYQMQTDAVSDPNKVSNDVVAMVYQQGRATEAEDLLLQMPHENTSTLLRALVNEALRTAEPPRPIKIMDAPPLPKEK